MMMEHAAATQATEKIARMAVEPIVSGMTVGLGSGRNAERAVKMLAQRVLDERLDIRCVCTSTPTEILAIGLGLNAIPFAEVESVDYLFDGAAEVDHSLRMLKGTYAAITRQRLVARVCKRCVYIAPIEKLSERLGTNALLSLTLVPFGMVSIRNTLRDMGLSGVIRRDIDGKLVSTDGGGVMLDLQIPPDRDIEELAAELDTVVGVVDHGIFLTEADEILLDCHNGEVRRMVRPA
ncbi:MAG: ribose 5-phosphate isomerase A [Phycisphaerales bacterium]|nr:MAG: ribose 5-phosphate isomerase A [Phycisphaerales bacterium]